MRTRVKQDPVAQKYGHLLAQMFDVFNETHPQKRPDFLIWMRDEMETELACGNDKFLDFMADAKKLRQK